MRFLMTTSFIFLWSILTEASPLQDNFKVTNSLARRLPHIWDGPDGFDETQRAQIRDGFSDMIILCQYAVAALDAMDGYSEYIMRKYFPQKDRGTVREIYTRFMGYPTEIEYPNFEGHAWLNDVIISPDYVNTLDGKMNCESTRDKWYGGLSGPFDDDPTIILCPPVFQWGGINKGYENIPAVTCDSFGDRLTWRMETLGHVLLHELTHWGKFVSLPLKQQTRDIKYGPVESQELRWRSPDEALYNADSWAWYATEALWTHKCRKRYFEALPSDMNDNVRFHGTTASIHPDPKIQ